MSKQDKQEKLGRRDFLRGAGVGAAAATVAVVAAAPAKVEAAENAQERKKARYKETEHVKTYYAQNRL
ncbi:twin-arginine translocation signal domain-containing protein [Ferrovibrio sp.]|uniref:twin-arginine translocation signal domain-containing protein n=1 Tax=Ferrovibrio sp. TaxID=1917215 RepID=UPI001B3DF852|nr:twin-arginine translocation signal domain-containing protein [Ferrovibrio sp.]MBP7064392.1 twin-arginine translocation signal domain-containing protein [Ferrovibrio sp.]